MEAAAPTLPPLEELIDDVFFAVQREPDAPRRWRLNALGMLLLDLRPHEVKLRDLLGQLAGTGYVRFVETG